MDKVPFIGTGHNPEGPDLPLGFGMHLMQDSQAVENFGKLNSYEKKKVIDYVQDVHTGNEAKEHIAHAISCLHEGTMPGV